MDLKSAELAFADLVRDPSVQKFEILSEEPNIFEILKVESYEIRHSNFLAWILNPLANHGLGSSILRQFLVDLSLESEDFSILNVGHLDYGKIEIRREWRSIDLLIMFPNFLIAIENKIFHFETKGQLKKYTNAIDEAFGQHKKLFVYLSPDGGSPSEKNYVSYSYESLVKIIEQNLELKSSISSRTRAYLEDYLNNLKNNIMGTGEKSELANTIYRQHRELFDFVIENKTSDLQELRSEIERMVIDRGWRLGTPSKQYLRFLTPELDEVIPKNVGGWNKYGEAFLFEMYFYENKRQLIIYCTVSPCEPLVKTKMLEIMKQFKTSKTESKTWSTYKTITINIDDHFDTVDINLKSLAEKAIRTAESIIKEVQPVILAHKDELSKLKQKYA